MESREITVTIKGMMCEHCKKTVEQTVSKITGVYDVQVALEQGIATITLSPEKDPVPEITSAIEEAGYSVENVS